MITCIFTATHLKAFFGDLACYNISSELVLLKSQRYVYQFMYIAVSTPSNNTTLIIGVIVATAILVLAIAAVVIVWLVLRHRRSMVSRQKGNM